jgi:hypothetical protein
MWVSDGRVIEKQFGEDIWGAKKLYRKVVRADRDMPTLRCCNIGLPPPPQFRAEKKLTVLNARGIWWCPYCCEFRRFVTKKYKRKITMHCPLCQISTRDFHVRRWNPEAVIMDFRRRQRGSKRRRRRVRTR